MGIVRIADVGVIQIPGIVAEFMGQDLHNGRMICAHPDMLAILAISSVPSIAASVVYVFNHYHVELADIDFCVFRANPPGDSD